MSENELLQKIKKILAEELEIEIEDIPDDAKLNDFDKWNSLNHIKLMLALENEFNIELNEESIRKLVSLKTIIEQIRL
jgi:acyl carrier protein